VATGRTGRSRSTTGNRRCSGLCPPAFGIGPSQEREVPGASDGER